MSETTRTRPSWTHNGVETSQPNEPGSRLQHPASRVQTTGSRFAGRRFPDPCRKLPEGNPRPSGTTSRQSPYRPTVLLRVLLHSRVRRPGWPSALATADVTPDESGCLTDGPRDVPAPVSSPPRRRQNPPSRPRPQRELPHPTPCDRNFNRPRDDILESDENKFPARDQAPTRDCPWSKGLQTDAGPTTPQHATLEPSP